MSSMASRTVQVSLLTHNLDYSEEEMLLDPELIEELKLTTGDLVEICSLATEAQPAVPSSPLLTQPKSGSPLVLRVTSSAPRTRLSVLKSVAEAFGLTARQNVQLRRIELREAELESVELGFKDQYVTRGDIWGFQRTLTDKTTTVFLSKTISAAGVRAQVQGMSRHGVAHAASGLLTERTRLRFRSRSAAFFILIQMSREMWELAPDGERYHEKAIAFLHSLFRRWAILGVSHTVSVVLFAREYVDESTATPFGAQNRGLMRDLAGRVYTDYYKLVTENESRTDWQPLLATLKRHFLLNVDSVQRREPFPSGDPTTYPSAAAAPDSAGQPAAPNDDPPGAMPPSADPFVGNSDAAHGNLIEAINLALDVLENSREEQDLASTGKSVVVISPGSGWYEVDYPLSQLTKQRMTDNGIGCDLVCCGSPPLHTVPLFTYVQPATAYFPAEASAFRVPHWVLISFTDPPPKPPLPSCRLGPAPPTDEVLVRPYSVPPLPEPPGLCASDPDTPVDLEAFALACAARDPALVADDSSPPYEAEGGAESGPDSRLQTPVLGAQMVLKTPPPLLLPKLLPTASAQFPPTGPIAIQAGRPQPIPGAMLREKSTDAHVGSTDSSGEGSFDGSSYMYGSWSANSLRPPHANFSVKAGLHASTDSLPMTSRDAVIEGYPASQKSNLNPFSFHVAADALALKRLSHNSYARRRWNHVYQPSVIGEAVNASITTPYQPHLEHQWTSLSAPAVLPLTTDPTQEHEHVMQKQAAAESTWWRIAVPRQEELSGLIPYKYAMSAEELLKELICQRLELDFQLLRPIEKLKRLSLQDEQTYYLSHGNQVQQITFVKDTNPLRNSHTRVGARGAAPPTPEPGIGGFSEIHVSRHLLNLRRKPMSRLNYYYSEIPLIRTGEREGLDVVAIPCMKGFQQMYSQIRPPTPFDFPWNRLDNIVCGWDCDLDLGIRLRSKRFTLLNFDDHSEGSLRRLLSAPEGTQRLLSAAFDHRAAPSPPQQLQDAPKERAPGAPVLNRDRFEKFLESVAPRLPLAGRVDWLSTTRQSHEASRSILVDMTPDVAESDGTRGRRMFVQIIFDSTAGEDQTWHMEVRWNMCQGHRVEELVKYCARRAKQVGLLFLQIPTGRRPRPFSPPVRVSLSDSKHGTALSWLSTHLCFVRESTTNQNARWMHELGVSFVQADPQGGAFFWSANQLMPSQTARSHSDRLLRLFRDCCEYLDKSASVPEESEAALKLDTSEPTSPAASHLSYQD